VFKAFLRIDLAYTWLEAYRLIELCTVTVMRSPACLFVAFVKVIERPQLFKVADHECAVVAVAIDLLK
jgi:hypothetical protein